MAVSGASRPRSNASAYAKALGRSLSPYDDLSAFVARKVFQRVYREDGTFRAQEPMALKFS